MNTFKYSKFRVSQLFLSEAVYQYVLSFFNYEPSFYNNMAQLQVCVHCHFGYLSILLL